MPTTSKYPDISAMNAIGSFYSGVPSFPSTLRYVAPNSIESDCWLCPIHLGGDRLLETTYLHEFKSLYGELSGVEFSGRQAYIQVSCLAEREDICGWLWGIESAYGEVDDREFYEQLKSDRILKAWRQEVEPKFRAALEDHFEIAISIDSLDADNEEEILRQFNKKLGEEGWIEDSDGDWTPSVDCKNVARQFTFDQINQLSGYEIVSEVEA
ncbi:MAG TPA: hypothetical protein V6D07_18545 [Trichocoleus sp.]